MCKYFEKGLETNLMIIIEYFLSKKKKIYIYIYINDNLTIYFR